MASKGPATVSSLLAQTIGIPIRILRYLSTEPTLTGALLYALTRGSPELKEKLLSPFATNLLATNGTIRLAKFISALKALFVYGLLVRTNSALNRFALNGWSLGKVGKPWNWNGKEELVVVTGGCSGFGYEMVKGFAGKARVVVVDVSDLPKALENLPEVHYYRCDLSDYEAIHSLADKIRNELGNPSVLINNAGIGGNGKPVLKYTDNMLDKVFRINLTSHFVLIREFLPAMLDNKKGHIVGIGSMASFIAAPGLLDYCCTKVGVLYLNDGLRAELLETQANGRCIQFTSVHPSWHSTAILKGNEDRLAKYGIYPDPAKNVSDEVVKQVVKGRSGRLVVPKHQEAFTNIRKLPIWFTDALAYVGRKSRGFSFAEEDGLV